MTEKTIDETAKTVFLITREEDFKKFRANGTKYPKGISHIYRDIRKKVPYRELLFEYIVDDSAVLRCSTKNDAEFFQTLLDRRNIEYEIHPYSEYLPLCAQEFSKK